MNGNSFKINKLKTYKYSKIVRFWLVIVLIMLIGQVLLNGISSLTGSDLSITKWDITPKIIPPIGKQQWNDVFELYKQTPQFNSINSELTLKKFKNVFFWEYFYKIWKYNLWTIILIPFIFFTITKKIDWYLIKFFFIVVILAVLTASTKLITNMFDNANQLWFSAYQSALQFLFAILTIGTIVKIISYVYNFENKSNTDQSKFTLFLMIITFIQLILSGLMSSMRASLRFPTWPSMNGKVIPEVLSNRANWTLHNLTNYESFDFAPALVQFSHRFIAYTILILTMFYYFKKRNNTYTRAIKWLTFTYTLVLFHVFLGILTLIKSKTDIPVLFTLLHQLTGLLFFVSLLFLHLSLKKNRIK